MKVGLIGLGRMGFAMALRLREAGFDVLAWDIDGQCREKAVSQGVDCANNPAEVCAFAETILSIVTDDDAVRWLFGSEHGVLAAGLDVSGKLFIEMSTLQPRTIRELAATVEERGAHLIGAPVLGTIPAAREGKLVALAGGRDIDIARAEPLFSALTKKVSHLGPAGAGNAMKLVVNLCMGAYLQALTEGLALGERDGLDLSTMLGVLSEAPTANPWLTAKLPVLLGAGSDVTLDISALRKDIISAVATGALSGVSMPLASGTLSALSAAVASGWGAEDLAQMPRFYREHMVRRSMAGSLSTAAASK